MTPEKTPRRMTADSWSKLGISILLMAAAVQHLWPCFSTPHEWNLKYSVGHLWLPVFFVVASVFMCFDAFRRS